MGQAVTLAPKLLDLEAVLEQENQSKTTGEPMQCPCYLHPSYLAYFG